MSLPKQLVFVILVLASLFLGKSVAAQVPDPYVPCDEVRPNLLHPLESEFHSLRPYQASPCNEDISGAAFCGNGIKISEQVSETQSLRPNLDPDCTLLDARTRRYKCTYDIHRGRTIAVDLSNAELPILGNTEDVINSQSADDGLDDAEKTNEYVSWYLSGVPWKKEYGEGTSEQLVNFSGPVNKLLPWDIQAGARIETIARADKDRHNQIVTPDGTRLEEWEGQIAPNLLSIPAKLYDLILPDWLVFLANPGTKGFRP